jgi:patatin-like phospholipase/acyl hydrolase
MYFHGTKKCPESPFAHADKHTFWVYPAARPLTNRWDTHHSAKEYCSNHIDEGVLATNPPLKQYVCLGHKSREEFAVAELEWSLHTKGQKNVHHVQTIQSASGLNTQNGTLALLELVKEQQEEIATLQIRLEALEAKLTLSNKSTQSRLESLEIIMEQKNEASILKSRTDKEILARLEALEERKSQPAKELGYEEIIPFKALISLNIIVCMLFYYYFLSGISIKIPTIRSYIDLTKQIEFGPRNLLLENPT